MLTRSEGSKLEKESNTFDEEKENSDGFNSFDLKEESFGEMFSEDESWMSVFEKNAPESKKPDGSHEQEKKETAKEGNAWGDDLLENSKDIDDLLDFCVERESAEDGVNHSILAEVLTSSDSGKGDTDTSQVTEPDSKIEEEPENIEISDEFEPPEEATEEAKEPEFQDPIKEEDPQDLQKEVEPALDETQAIEPTLEVSKSPTSVSTVKSPETSAENIKASTPNPSPALEFEGLSGRWLGKYLVSAQIGRGAMGGVFLTHHGALNIPVAMKILDPSLAARKRDYVVRFLREAQMAARIDHINVVRVMDCGELEGYYFLVMEYVSGMSLLEFLRIVGPMPEVRALAMVKAVSQGLASALELGIIHCDIKPANILIAKTGLVKLTDLGLAKSLDRESFISNQEITDVGLGTPDYLPPERAGDPSSADHRADIYSLGATLYFMLTGRKPFKGKSITELIHKHMVETPPLPHKINPAISQRTSALIMEMMQKKMEDRPRTYKDLIKEIDSCLMEAVDMSKKKESSFRLSSLINWKN